MTISTSAIETKVNYRKLSTLLSLIVCINCLFGCVGTQTYLRLLESNGTVRTDIADDKSYDFKVSVKNLVDFGWDGDSKADRLKTVLLMFGNRCREVSVIDEIPVETGTYATGKPSITWVMRVKCLR